MTRSKQQLEDLRAIPAIDVLLRTDEARTIADRIGADATAELSRQVCDQLRAELVASLEGSTSNRHTSNSLLIEATRRLCFLSEQDRSAGIRRVINATGVILHTNLGRAPLARSVRDAMVKASGYCTVEYDLKKGVRGPRGIRGEQLLAQLTGAEDAVVVNNGAAAALLVLTALSGGGEVILSRGELVEIGGDFRIPDVMAQSGAQLDEVGTTNRTKLADYERAITPATTMLMRVHPSNFRLVGFTASPELRDLAQLAHQHGLILYEDAGSGALIDLTKLGVDGEPMIADSIAAGADVVTFSGDKLLGGIQAGFIVGRRDLIDKVRRHPLYRALRPDKTTLAAMEATLLIYRRGAATEEIPALAMINADPGDIGTRAMALVQALNDDERTVGLTVVLIPGESAIGGGAAPTTHPPTMLIALTHATLSADDLDAALRRHDPPVIARINEGRVVLDLRTVMVDEEPELLSALRQIGN